MARPVITGAAQLLYTPAGNPAGTRVQVTALSGGTHYIGQSGVTSATGVPLNAGDKVVLTPVVPLYAVNVSSGTLDVSVG